MDFGELKHDVNFVTRVTDFDHSLEELQEHVKWGLEVDVTKLAKEGKTGSLHVLPIGISYWVLPG